MVSPILHYTQIQGNEGQFMCIQKFPNDDPAQVVSTTVTANPFANPGVPDFGVLPAGNSQIPGFNLPSDFPATFELSLPDDMTASEQNENFFERTRREAFEISFENKTSPVFDKPASSLNLSGLSIPSAQNKTDEIECKMNDIFNILKERVLRKCRTSKSKMLLRYLYSIFVLGFIIPLGVICYCYGRIMLKVKRTENRAKRFVSNDITNNPMWRAFTDTVTQPFVKYGMKKEAKIHLKMPVNSTARTESTARRQLNRFVTLLLSTFVICRLPWYSWHLVKAHDFHINLENCEIITDVTFCLAYMSSAINPLLYIFLGQDFRRRWNRCKSRIRAKLAKHSYPRWISGRRKSAKFSKNSGNGRTVTSDLATRKSSFLTKDVTSSYLKTKDNCVTIGAEMINELRTNANSPSNFICNDQCVNIDE